MVLSEKKNPKHQFCNSLLFHLEEKTSEKNEWNDTHYTAK